MRGERLCGSIAPYYQAKQAEKEKQSFYFSKLRHTAALTRRGASPDNTGRTPLY
jgi:hypothetical protein